MLDADRVQTNKEAKAEARKVQKQFPGSLLKTGKWAIYVYFEKTEAEVKATADGVSRWNVKASWDRWTFTKKEKAAGKVPGWYRERIPVSL